MIFSRNAFNTLPSRRRSGREVCLRAFFGALLAFGMFSTASLRAQVASNSATGLSYGTVQAAIDAWGSNYTVFILANTAAAISINNKTNLVVTGTNNVSPFRITGAGTGTGVTITNRSRNIVVSNLIIERFALGVSIDRCQSNAVSLTVRSNQNSACPGAGVHLNYATNNIIDGIIHDNTNVSGANDYGGAGLYAIYSVSNTISAHIASNVVTNTTGVPSGGGVYIVSGRFNVVSGNIVANRISNSVGGGIDFDYGYGNSITGNVTKNSAWEGGGIYLFYCTNTYVNSAVVSNIAAAGSGGGIYMAGCTSNAIAGALTYNIATNPAYYDYGAGLVMKSCITNMVSASVGWNTAASSGGGIYCSNVRWSVFSGPIFSNSQYDPMQSGGGIFLNFSSSNTISGDVFDNICSNGYGGGIDIDYGFSNSIFGAVTGNFAKYGGGVFVFQTGNVLVSNANISFNTAITDDGGGGFYALAGGSIKIYGSVSSNTASHANAMGGGIRLEGATNCIVAADIIGNRAPYGGGGIYLSDTRNTTITGKIISNYSGGNGSSGGGVYLASSDSNYISAQIMSNLGQFGGGICVDYGKTNMIDGYFYGNIATNGAALYGFVASNLTVSGSYGGNTAFRSFFLQSALFGIYSNMSVFDDRSTISVFYTYQRAEHKIPQQCNNVTVVRCI